MNAVAIILARGGSKGIPKKNIIDFCGKPMIGWTIEQCLHSPLVSSVWVSSDCPEILAISEQHGAKTIKRPDDISGDKASSESAWTHAIEHIEGLGDKIDVVVAPQLTSPLRESSDITNALNAMSENGYDSLLSVCAIEDFFMWERDSNDQPASVNYDYKDRKPRQQITEKYLENGSFYLFKPAILAELNNRLGGKIGFHMMDRHKMFQIDNPEDIELCEVIMKGYGMDKLTEKA